MCLGWIENLLEDIVARHTCNNPWCVNPSHIISGTHSDNQRDMTKAGRKHGQRVSLEEAKEMRRRFAAGDVTRTELVREYGITRRTVNDILILKSHKEPSPMRNQPGASPIV